MSEALALPFIEGQLSEETAPDTSHKKIRHVHMPNVAFEATLALNLKAKQRMK